MHAPFKVAFIGCGRRARRHVPAILADPRCKIVALSDLNAAAADSMKSEFHLDAAIYTDRNAMLIEHHPEIVVSCLWTPLHLPVFRDCVAAGVRAVLSEKPMAPTWADSQEMARLAEHSGCQLTFCHQRRFAAGNQLVRQLIESGRFGPVQRMDLYSVQPNLLDCGTHTIDQAISFNAEIPAKWVLGAVDATSHVRWFDVTAKIRTVDLYI